MDQYSSDGRKGRLRLLSTNQLGLIIAFLLAKYSENKIVQFLKTVSMALGVPEVKKKVRAKVVIE